MLGSHGNPDHFRVKMWPNRHVRPILTKLFFANVERAMRCRKRLSWLTGIIILSMIAVATAEPFVAQKKSLAVIAPKNFHGALTDFIAFKTTQLPTRLAGLEDILSATPGSDDPEKLKHWLYNAWKKDGLGYALLVGDGDIMPLRYMVLDRVTPAAFDYAFYPSDLYYADLAKPDGSFESWNAKKDDFHGRYFGEVRGEKNKNDPINYDAIDYRPEIAVGRWPVSTVKEVKLVATKSMTTEKRILNRTHPGLRRVGLIAVGGWVDSRPHLDRIAAALPKSWKAEKRYYADRGAKASTQAPNSEQVCGLLNSGVEVIFHAGHGTGDQWEQCLAIKHIDGLTNSDRLPVMISAGCGTALCAPLPPYTAYVDESGQEHRGTDAGEVFTAPPPPPSPYQKGKYNLTGLGEQMLRHSANGAVAYIGCNTGSQPCGLTLLEGFANGISDQAEPRLGDAWAFAVRYYFDHEHLATLKPNNDWYPPSIFFQGMKFMLFGDPTLRLSGPGKD
jgi:hypothetical protein